MSLQLGAAALDRIRLAVGAEIVAGVRELPGGTHATTHLVRMVRPSVEVVVQQYPPGDDAGTRSADVLAGKGIVTTIIVACIFFCIPTPWPVL